jgi:hypothetical protein
MLRTLDHRVSDLRLSAAAIDMARQLAEPDGRVVFDRHPLSNEPLRWGVEARDLTLGHAGRFAAVDPYRQLLAYGLAEVAPCDPPYVVVDEWTRERITHPWSVVLTERGRAWVERGCPGDVRPPTSAPGRRRAA